MKRVKIREGLSKKDKLQAATKAPRQDCDEGEKKDVKKINRDFKD